MIEKVKGLVRPTLAWAAFGVAAYLTMTGKVDPKEFMVLVSAIIFYWVGSRSGTNGNTTT